LAQHRRSPERHALPVHDRDGLRFGFVDLGLDEVEATLRTCPACRSFDKVQLANTPCSQVRRRSLGHDTRRLHPTYSHVVVKVSARKHKMTTHSAGAKTGHSGARTPPVASRQSTGSTEHMLAALASISSECGVFVLSFWSSCNHVSAGNTPREGV